jgi:hypothetical protein
MSRLAVAGTILCARTKKRPGGTRRQVRALKAQHHPIKQRSRRGVKSRNGLR